MRALAVLLLASCFAECAAPRLARRPPQFLPREVWDCVSPPDFNQDGDVDQTDFLEALPQPERCGNIQ